MSIPSGTNRLWWMTTVRLATTYPWCTVTCGGIEKGMRTCSVLNLVAVAGAKREDFHPRIVGLTGTPEQVKKAGESSTRKLAKWTKHMQIGS